MKTAHENCSRELLMRTSRMTGDFVSSSSDFTWMPSRATARDRHRDYKRLLDTRNLSTHMSRQKNGSGNENAKQ